MAQVVERPLWEREAPGSSPGAPIFCMAFSLGSVQNITHSPADIAQQASLSAGRGLTSREIVSTFDFSSLFISVNATFPPGSSLLLEAQVRVGTQWSPFYKLAFLSDTLKTSFPPQADSFARVATDEIRLVSPANAYRYRVHLSGKAVLSLVHVCLVKKPFLYDEENAAQLPPGSREIRVSPISQLEQQTADCRRICSPVSLCMALDTLGVVCPLAEVLSGVFDPVANIYGNWLFNVVFAAQQGVHAYARRFGALKELDEFVTDESCVVASIAFEQGQLTGAPLPATQGHLVLVRGWKDGYVLAADPAAPAKDSVLRAYSAREFARAWLKNKQGISYIVRKK